METVYNKIIPFPTSTSSCPIGSILYDFFRYLTLFLNSMCVYLFSYVLDILHWLPILVDEDFEVT